MGSEIWAGMFGLGGAVVGAGGAVLGGWLQVRATRRERVEGYRREAAQAALNELIQLSDDLHARYNSLPADPEYGTSSEFQNFMHSGRRRLVAMQKNALLIPDRELRDRLATIYRVGIAWLLSPGLRAGSQILWMLCASDEGIRLLAAFLRGDPLPQEFEGFAVIRRVEEARN
ncbi:hypothetical protein [Streptomyces sp. SID10815]|uniref:hypothetical protein n=1 Tax=Streptomyces sp. SID10815 TaxID=2706027 RepID=UPI0013CB80B7|nr:hypothetical protein [Streptomyces sp. SID10815]NEA51012.1 hypothetical protein [Streptomyces sp. SID10815]